MQKRSWLRLGPLPVVLLAVACASGTPDGPSPTPTPSVPTYSVTATVFYDEDGNGQLDAGEVVRVPGVEVVIGSVSARSASGTGQALVSGIVEGATSVAVRTESLPMYFQPPAAVPIQVPGPSEVRIPLRLAIGRNNPNIYLGFGDSITRGDGSSDGLGYRFRLQALLGASLGYADVRTWGREGDTSSESADLDVIHRTLRSAYPAYTLILFGTNDWHDCQSKAPADCYTIASLRTIVENVRDWGSLPVLGTIIPGNPALVPAGRNAWYDDMNVLIKALARDQNVALADLNAEFKAQPNLPALFYDDVHPNDQGYQALAQGWSRGITRSRSAAAALPSFGFRLP
jgi:lysophospholipase L1-like esterase